MKNKRIITFATLWAVALLFVFSGCADDLLETTRDNESAIVTRGGDGVSPYYFYDHEGEKIYLSLNTEHAFLSAAEPILSADMMQRGIKATEFQLDNSKGKSGTSRFWTELSFEAGLSNEQYMQLLSDVRQQNKDILVAPYFNDQYGNKIGLSNFFYVKLKDESDAALLEKTAAQYDCVIVSQDEFMPLWFTLSISGTSELTALEAANIFHESGLFAVGEPDLMADIALSNDLYYAQQWVLKNTGQYGGTAGIDINIEPALSISTGTGVVVAVIDQGIDLDHPDLAANKYSRSHDCQTGGVAPQQIRGPHGTAVAGIIGAVMNNTSGIAGVAPNCKIMSISHSLRSPNTNIRQQLAAGINWAWLNGAHVINCSWGHQTALSGSYITDAINNAITKGRGNKGCVVVVSSGNDNLSTVSYPASLPSVIAVGAISFNGMRKSPTTPDTEWRWGSNYGNELDVVAPGVLVPTTDIRGNTGYNLAALPSKGIHIDAGGSILSSDYSDQNYTVWFDGTSAAAPHVSGIAALMLSADPNLTYRQVADIIESTALKVGGYSYSPSNHNGTWNSQMGHGLVDAFRAVGMANFSITGPDRPYLHTNVSYSVSNIPAGVTFSNWVITPSTYTTSGTTSNNLNITFNNSGIYTLTAQFRTPNNNIIDFPPKTVGVPDVTPLITPRGTTSAAGTPITFSVYNPHPTGTYEWRVNGWLGNSSSSVLNTVIVYGPGDRMVIDCRGYINGVWTDWAMPLIIVE